MNLIDDQPSPSLTNKNRTDAGRVETPQNGILGFRRLPLSLPATRKPPSLQIEIDYREPPQSVGDRPLLSATNFEQFDRVNTANYPNKTAVLFFWQSDLVLQLDLFFHNGRNLSPNPGHFRLRVIVTKLPSIKFVPSLSFWAQRTTD